MALVVRPLIQVIQVVFPEMLSGLVGDHPLP